MPGKGYLESHIVMAKSLDRKILFSKAPRDSPQHVCSTGTPPRRPVREPSRAEEPGFSQHNTRYQLA